MTMREAIPFRHALGFLAAALSLTAVVPALVPPAVAQDVPGIELCTRERQMDRRTGCLQSNVEYLQQLIAKNSLDAQQRLAAASREIAAQKDQLAAANKEIAALKDALAELKTRADQAPAAVAARELATLRDAVRDLRARVDDAQKAKPK
jgi:septal ring factor EnvC (AmiA/AmiB activator)